MTLVLSVPIARLSAKSSILLKPSSDSNISRGCWGSVGTSVVAFRHSAVGIDDDVALCHSAGSIDGFCHSARGIDGDSCFHTALDIDGECIRFFIPFRGGMVNASFRARNLLEWRNFGDALLH